MLHDFSSPQPDTKGEILKWGTRSSPPSEGAGGRKNGMTYILCLCCCFLFVKNAHSQTLSFEKENLETVFQQIEKKTDWTFNYDPEVIDGYSYTGRINLAKPDIFLKKILRNTPFEFETVRESVLIILPEKREYLLCGYLMDKEHKNVLPFANVQLEGLKKGTTTDMEGRFELKVKTHKDQRIVFSYIGYSSQKYRIDTWESGDCRKIFLKQTPQTLGVNVTVRDQIIRSVSQGGNKTQLDYDRLRKKNTYEEYDALKTVQHLPGITSTDETATNLSMRGSTSDQNLILWEGVRLYDPGHFYGMISAINPFVINKVDVYKDSYAPHFGNAIGGVVDMSLPSRVGRPISGGFGSNFTEAHAHIATPLSKNGSSLIASSRHSINGLFDSTPTIESYADKVFQYSLADDETEDSETGEMDEDNDFVFYDYNIKAVGRLHRDIKIESAYFQSHNDFFTYSRFAEEDSEIGEETMFDSKALSTRLTANLGAGLDWHSELYHTWSSYQNMYNFEYREEGEDEDYLDSETSANGISDHQFGMLNTLKISKKIQVRLGYNYENKAVNYEYSQSSDYEEEYDEEEYLQGNFHNIIGSILYEKDALRLEAHMRNTYYSELKQVFFSPRITMQYKLHPTLKLRFSTGRFYQFISQVEDFQDSGFRGTDGFWVLHSEFVDDVLRSYKIALGGTWTKNKWMLDVEAYWRNNFGILGASSFSNGNHFELTGDSEAVGLDVLLYREWKYFGVWANYSLAKHTMYFPDIYDEKFPANNDHRHSLNLTGSVNFKKWQGTLTWKYRSGLPFSSEPNVIRLVDEDDEEDVFYEFEYDRINDRRQNPYSRLDAALSYKTTFRLKERPKIRLKKVNLEARLALTNLLGIENLAQRNYQLSDNEDLEEETPEPISIEKYLLGTTPQFLLRFYW